MDNKKSERNLLSLGGIAAALAGMIKKDERLMETGVCLEAEVMDVKENPVEAPAHSQAYYDTSEYSLFSREQEEKEPVQTYFLVCKYEDEKDGSICFFRSKDLTCQPLELIGRKIKVYAQKDNFENYFVDVDSALVEE